MAALLDEPVFLLGMPRSGTTWLSQIFESARDFVVRLSPPYSYAFRDRLSAASRREDWHEVLQGAISSEDAFLTQDWRRDSGELTRFEKDSASITRLAIKDTRFHHLYRAAMTVLPEAQTIYIVRHPAASLWSWKNCKEFPADADFGEEWRTARCRKREGPGEYWGFDDWLALAAEYRAAAKTDPRRYLIVRYEDLVRSPDQTAERMFGHCGLPLRPETAEFISRSRSSFDPRPYSVFKGDSLREDWREDFPENILRTIENETRAAGMEEYLA